ncbi:hypothetical protein SKAU_G00368070 [Synaphobranchus kaupii]|uniref:Uncharacterized protein n=1 Tax=Synaphobranchus kaupii TaxID=118154 RepID=A0A9Q1EFH7_SYNKA|nr:hypothetical protein SKAU_G00368070 [Synaphobranchus kaupii]
MWRRGGHACHVISSSGRLHAPPPTYDTLSSVRTRFTRFCAQLANVQLTHVRLSPRAVDLHAVGPVSAAGVRLCPEQANSGWRNHC